MSQLGWGGVVCGTWWVETRAAAPHPKCTRQPAAQGHPAADERGVRLTNPGLEDEAILKDAISDVEAAGWQTACRQSGLLHRTTSESACQSRFLSITQPSRECTVCQVPGTGSRSCLIQQGLCRTLTFTKIPPFP